MLAKWFSLQGSKVKSQFVFQLPVHTPDGQQNWKPFRDPVALSTLETLARLLRDKGCSVSLPKPGKACDAAFHVTFPSVIVTVITLVERTNQTVQFSVFSWPYQTFKQCITRRASSPDEFSEWVEVCADLNDILTRTLKPESLEWVAPSPIPR